MLYVKLFDNFVRMLRNCGFSRVQRDKASAKYSTPVGNLVDRVRELEGGRAGPADWFT
jgi:hypothetical protein